MSQIKKRCQSCGMPLGEGYYGTDTYGNFIEHYCKFCFQKGQFLEPQLTVDMMIKRSIENMTKDLHLPLNKATNLANYNIPQLERWKKNKAIF